jgi:hypothetical protein
MICNDKLYITSLDCIAALKDTAPSETAGLFPP